MGLGISYRTYGLKAVLNWRVDVIEKHESGLLKSYHGVEVITMAQYAGEVILETIYIFVL